MEVITMDSQMFKNIMAMLENISGRKETDKIFTLEQAADYVGVEKRWIYTRRKKISFIQEG